MGGDGVLEAVTRTTRALLDLLPKAAAPGPTLDIGSDGGAVALEAGCPYLHADLPACEQARAAGAMPVIHSDALPAGPFGTISFDARTYETALALETLAQAAVRLAPGGVVLTTARRADVAALFGEVEEHGEALLARSPISGAYRPEWPVYEFEFGGRVWQVRSGPGVFSPRGLDEGTRVMLQQMAVPAGARFLDLGCGAGAVSLIASEAWGCQVTAVDVNARALRLTAMNAPRAEVLASDGLTALSDREFDVIASNPPYHTDYAVAKAFIEGAHRRLAMGGTLCLVVKKADWYVQKVRTIFGGCRVHEEAGYTLLIAEKRERRPAAAAGAPVASTTKKHAKRMADAARSRQRRPR